MKLKDLPPTGSHVTLFFKPGHIEQVTGIIHSAHKMPPGYYPPADSWRVPFWIEGSPESDMRSFSIRSIERWEPAQEKQQILQEFKQKLEQNMQDLPPGISEAVDKDFWELG